ncbi:copper resistance CopC family protein [Castellaniella sp.]|uniref:copper resistance CopC family protein n=1 Tax=Castellaniella sp. TaxID=1955812 RepID=UPI002AFE1451|nr:copper resistance CopC family protein [Castellaniella sp.]
MKSFLAACLLLWSQIAWGGIALVATSLPSDSTLAQPPAEVSLVFSEAVWAARIDLVDPQGLAQPLHAIRDARAEIRIPIPPETAYGVYALNWHVESAAGDAVSGALGYELAEPSFLDRLWPGSPVPLRDAALWSAAIVLLAAALALLLFRPQFASATLGLIGVGLMATGFQFDRVAALWRLDGGWVAPVACAGALALLGIVGAGRMWLRGR